MYTGKIVEESGVDEMFADPKHPYTRGLIRSVPKLSEIGIAKTERLQTIDGTVPSPTNLPVGCHFAAPRCEFKMDMCTRDEIPFIETPSGARVRCVLFDPKRKFEIARERTLSAVT